MSVPNPTEVVTVQKLSEMVIFYKSMIYVGLKIRGVNIPHSNQSLGHIRI